MRILRIPDDKPVTIYILERQVRKNVWRLMFADPGLLVGGGVFEDINWDDSSLWAPFSTRGEVFSQLGIPGTFKLEEALKAYEHLSKTLAQGYRVRLRKVTVTISSEVMKINEEVRPPLTKFFEEQEKERAKIAAEKERQRKEKEKLKSRRRRKREKRVERERINERPQSTWSPRKRARTSNRSQHS